MNKTLEEKAAKNAKLSRAGKIARFAYLSAKIAKYAHRWGEEPSVRLSEWVFEYNNLREDDRDAFNAYCDTNGLCRTHNGYDCLA